MYHKQGSTNLAYTNTPYVALHFWQKKNNLRNSLYSTAKANNLIFEIVTVGIFIGSLIYSESISQKISYLSTDGNHKIECTMSSDL
jgi:hypothetical protein